MRKLPEIVDGWLEVAEMDMVSAGILAKQDFLSRMAGFHAQQAAEKCLKAVMASLSMDIPRTHNLPQLAVSLAEVLPELNERSEDLAWLSGFAVDLRYPLDAGLATTREHAERAIKIAEHIKEICLYHLKSQ